MASVDIWREGTVVRLRADALEIVLANEVIATRPIHEVDALRLHGAVTLEPITRNTLARRGIDVTFYTRYGHFRGRLLGAESGFGERRMAQYRALSSAAGALGLARAFVAGKIGNQRHVLQRARRSDNAVPLAAIVALRSSLARVDAAGDLNTLRGIEGLAARLYFEGLSASLARVVTMRGRSRRPPLDPANAALSFGYTLLLRHVESAVLGAGMDLYVGALHEPGRSKPALALDLMEEFRPIAVDRVVRRLFVRGQLQADRFDHRDGGVFLGREGCALLIAEINDAMRARVAYDDEGRLRLSDVVRRQAEKLAAGFSRGEPSHTPFLLR